jgi:hypothetical protein
MVRVNPTTGEVEVLGQDGSRLWSGKPLGYSATIVLPIRGTEDCIVLLDPDAHLTGQFQNLLRLSAGGSVVWQADLPVGQHNDAYVAVEWSGGRLVANTWSAYRVDLDVNNGRILRSTFTK